LKRWYKAWAQGQPIAYIDETGFAPTTHRHWGWAPRGQRVFGRCNALRHPRTSLIGAYLNRHLRAPLAGAHHVVDNGNGTFKLPDLRNTFARAAADAADPDSANARTVGSRQGDAIRNIAGKLGITFGTGSGIPKHTNG
jgi:hypothetical protein